MVVRFTPSNINFSQIPTISTASQQAASNLFGQVSQTFNNVAAQANEIAAARAEVEGQRTGREAVQQGLEQGQQPSEIFSNVASQDDLTVFGQAQFRAAQAAFAVSTKAEIDSVLSEIATRNASNPEAYITEARAAIDGFTKELPEEVGSSIQNMVASTISADASKISKSAAQADIDAANSLLANSINQGVEQLLTFTQTEDAERFNIKAAELNTEIDGAVELGILTEAQAAVKKQEVLTRVNEEAAVLTAASQDSFTKLQGVLSERGLLTSANLNKAISLRAQRESQIEADEANVQKNKKQLRDTKTNQFLAQAIEATPLERAELRANLVKQLQADGASPAQISDAVNNFDNIDNFAIEGAQDATVADINEIIFNAEPEMEEQLQPLLARVKDPLVRQELQESAATRREFLAQSPFIKTTLNLELDKIAPVIKNTTGIIDTATAQANKTNLELRVRAEAGLLEAIRNGEVSRERIPAFIKNELLPSLTGGEENAGARRAIQDIEDSKIRAALNAAVGAETSVPIRIGNTTETLKFPKLSPSTADEYIKALDRQINSIDGTGFGQQRRLDLIERRKVIKELFGGE